MRAWDRRFRKAARFSARSAFYKTTKSQCNTAEAKFVVAFAEALSAFDPQGQNIVKIKPENIGIIIPYSGQKFRLSDLLTERVRENQSVRALNDIPGLMTYQWQSSEMDIGLIS